MSDKMSSPPMRASPLPEKQSELNPECAEKGHKRQLHFKPVDYAYFANPYTMGWRIHWVRRNAEASCKRCGVILRERSSGGCCPFGKTQRAQPHDHQLLQAEAASTSGSSSSSPIGTGEIPPTYEEAVPYSGSDDVVKELGFKSSSRPADLKVVIPK